MARNLTQVAATGDVVTGSTFVHSIVLTPAAAVATLEIRDGAAGAVRVKLQAAANGNSATWTSGDHEGVLFSSTVHATLSGAGAVAAAEYS